MWNYNRFFPFSFIDAALKDDKDNSDGYSVSENMPLRNKRFRSKLTEFKAAWKCYIF